MSLFIRAVAVLLVIFGGLAFLGAKSAIHEILGAVSVGLGIVTLALGTVVAKLDAILQQLKLRA